MKKYPKYIIKNSSNGQFYWNLHAINGEVIMTSETYVSKQSCMKGIESSKVHTADKYFQRETATNGQYYFNQISGNWEVIGTSEMYNSIQARENGISAVKRDAPIAEVEDLTVSGLSSSYV